MVDGTTDRSSVLTSVPAMNTYGDLYEKIPRLRPGFMQAQGDAAEHVFRALYPFVNQGLVDRIVDLGCGNGAILEKLQERFGAASPDLSERVDKVSLIGIDSDIRLVNHLEPKSKNKISLEFVLADAINIHSQVNDKTALLVLGHTIFHFAHSLESFDRFMSGLKPVLWVIDCHRTWNEALARVEEQGVALEPVWEETPGGPIICLRTTKLDGACVRRGLVRRADSLNEPTQPLFETTQLAVKTDKLKEKLADLGYFTALSYEYYSSWGPMSSSVFVRDLTTDVQRANNSWYTAISSALSEIFRSPQPESENAFSAVGKAIKLYKVRCAAVILPFDRIHTFARYAPLDLGTVVDLDATGAWGGDGMQVMILEEPSQYQAKYPTAYGLYTCILGRTSSIQVFPLRLIANYQMSKVDRDFNKYEDNFFAGCTAGGTAAEPERAFFLLPVFFGNLPLFVLVLQFGDTFSELDTGPGLFRSCLLDLHQQLREIFDEQFLRERILRPFLRDAYEHLKFPDKPFSQDQESSDLDYSKPIVFENATNKHWKSWVLALPGTEIRLKRTVIVEQANLDRIVKDEIDRLQSDVFFRLSRKLEEVGFFAGDRGRKGTSKSNKNPHEEPTEKHHRIILKHGLAIEDKLSRLVDFDSHYQDVIKWSAARMDLLIREGEAAQSGSLDAFKDLKAVYCRALENTGEFRFSVRRLECMIEIATGVRVEASVAPNCTLVPHLIIPRPIEEDPCQGLFGILHDLKVYWKQEPMVTIEIDYRKDLNGANLPGLAAKVVIDFSGAQTDGGMGQDSRHLLESLRRWCSTELALTDPGKTRTLVARLEVGPGIEESPRWRSLHTELLTSG